jgi:hypothetical protein
MAHKEQKMLEENYELCTGDINEMEKATGHNPLNRNTDDDDDDDDDKMNISVYF